MKTNLKEWWATIPPKERDKRIETLLIKYHAFEFVEDINEESFLALHNAGKKSWKVLSGLLEKYYNRPPYSEEQRRLMLEFARAIEFLTVTFLDREDADSIYERSRDEKIDEYLTKILKR